MQQLKRRQLQDAGGDVSPEPDGTQWGHAVSVPQRSDVQAGNFMLHFCAAGRKEKSDSSQPGARGQTGEAESLWARRRDVHSPDLPELLGSDLQVVQGSSHSHHHLVAVTGSHADVLPVGLFPLAHQGFGFLTDQSHRGRGDLRRKNTSARSQDNTSLFTSAQGSTAAPATMRSTDLNYLHR